MIWDCFDTSPPDLHSDNNIVLPGTNTRSPQVFNCDYDVNCTKLYSNIERANWDAVDQFLITGKWRGFSWGAESSPQEQAKTFVTCFDQADDVTKQIRWSFLPLHAAIIYSAPLLIVRRLVQTYPKTIQWPDNDGDTALHLAFLCAFDEIVLYLLETFPDALNIKAKDGCTPLQRAMQAKKSKSRGIILDVFIKQTKMMQELGWSASDEETNSTKRLYCDYEAGCNELFLRIQLHEWDAIVTFLETGHWPDKWFYTLRSCFDDAPTAKEQTRTWVTRFDRQGNVKGCRLPLHEAIICGAPYSVIKALIDNYPSALRFQDEWDMLPLHLALYLHASDDILAYMLLTYPESVNKRGRRMRSSMKFALRSKNNTRGKILQLVVVHAMTMDSDWTSSDESETRNDREVVENEEREDSEAIRQTNSKDKNNTPADQCVVQTIAASSNYHPDATENAERTAAKTAKSTTPISDTNQRCITEPTSKEDVANRLSE